MQKIVLTACTSLLIGLLSCKMETKVASNTVKVALASTLGGQCYVSPAIPADSLIAAGTSLRLQATPAEGYALDAIFYTTAGGPWGTLHHLAFEEVATITADVDMTVGAVFVEAERVAHLNVVRDVVYAQPGAKPLKYDVYSPKGAENLPGVVIIHGGGWSSNDEDVMRGLAWELARTRELVVFSVDYRWINDLDGDATPNNMHNLIEDVWGAVAHIQEHAEAYGLDRKRLGLTGDSAGGHLSAAGAVMTQLIGTSIDDGAGNVYVYTPTYVPDGVSLEALRADMTASVRAVAPSYGPFDAADFKDFLRQKTTAYQVAVSPIVHVPAASERLIPHFIVVGSEDRVVPKSAIEPYVAVLKEQGQPVTYLTVEGANHAFFDWKPDAATRATFEEYGVPYAAQMRAFFVEALAGE